MGEYWITVQTLFLTVSHNQNVFKATKIKYLCRLLNPLLVLLSKAKHGTRGTMSLIQHGISDVLMKNVLFGA